LQPDTAKPSGCNKAIEPVKLAKFLLGNERILTEERISAAMHAGREWYVRLRSGFRFILLTSLLSVTGKTYLTLEMREI